MFSLSCLEGGRFINQLRHFLQTNGEKSHGRNWTKRKHTIPYGSRYVLRKGFSLQSYDLGMTFETINPTPLEGSGFLGFLGIYIWYGPLPVTVTTRISCLGSGIPINLHFPLLQGGHIQDISGQIIIFHQPRFPWNMDNFPYYSLPFGVREPCEVAIIWPDI